MRPRYNGTERPRKSLLPNGAMDGMVGIGYADPVGRAAMRTSIARILGLVATCAVAVSAMAEDAPPNRRILYGDLHTHTYLSADAVLVQVLQGIERGPEAACDYARACASVDFFGFSDHAEVLDQPRWQRTLNAVRACNVAGEAAASPDGEPAIVSFAGFEWTSSSTGQYWGHKNVFFRNDAVPPQAIGAYTVSEIDVADFGTVWRSLALMQERGVTSARGLRGLVRAIEDVGQPRCRDASPGDKCVRVADEPQELWRWLREGYADPELAAAGYDVIAIPHGTAWGMTKVATDWSIQSNAVQHDPDIQRLIEVYSGHGNSEEWRDPVTDNWETCYQRAARLTAAHCRINRTPVEACQPLIAEAHRTARVRFATRPEHWGRCGQCPDCFQPAERYTPTGSVQTALASRTVGPDGTVTHAFRFGLIAATDDHSARPASVMERRALADWTMGAMFPPSVGSGFSVPGRNRVEAERVASYFYPGGLVAVHAERRTREDIWQALRRREVYGTSGPRMALWFDAVQAGQRHPMGSELSGDRSPVFEVEAWGGPVELPGCSAAQKARWGERLLRDVCLDTCFNPGNERVGIERLEIVRIRPQNRPNEPLRELIEDPWRVIANEDRRPDGTPSPRMRASFTDESFGAGARDALYYVRAIQTATPAVNGVPMSGPDGRVVPCPAGIEGGDCLVAAEERAWSSPIWVDFRR